MALWKFFVTPGHGYLEVAKVQAEAAGFVPSNCSYETQSLLFLEEDCDAPAFLRMVEGRLTFDRVATVHVDWSDPYEAFGALPCPVSPNPSWRTAIA